MLKKVFFLRVMLYLVVLNFDIVYAQSFNKAGWSMDITNENGISSQINATYTITEDDVNDNKVDIDLSFIFEFLNYNMLVNQIKRDVNPSINLTIENKSGKKITFSEYEFKTSNYQVNGEIVDYKITDMSIYNNSDNTIALGNVLNLYHNKLKEQNFDMQDNISLQLPTLNTIGFDKEPIKVSSLFYRPQSKAMVALLGANNLTLNGISNIGNRVKEKFSFIDVKGKEINLEEDSTRTYGEYVKLYYNVDSLLDLTDVDMYDYFNSNILIKGYDSLVVEGVGIGSKYIRKEDLNNSVNDEFKRWGKAIVSEYNNEYVFSNFYMLESDIELQQLAYRYIYNNIIRFTFNNKVMPLSNVHNSDHSMGILSYINKDSAINQLVNQQFQYGVVL